MVTELPALQTADCVITKPSALSCRQQCHDNMAYGSVITQSAGCSAGGSVAMTTP
ncbi:hypothetical protein J6590_008331 [Homalodisca vitripennis]|nr:hypothetical protein J6590_008331 [Homalodisca vitripennis]